MTALSQSTRRKLSPLQLAEELGNVSYSLGPPTHGQQRVANVLRLQNVNISPTGVRAVWMRHGLETRHRRLLQPEQHAQEETVMLVSRQPSLDGLGR